MSSASFLLRHSVDRELRYQRLCRVGMLGAAVLHWVAAALICGRLVRRRHGITPALENGRGCVTSEHRTHTRPHYASPGRSLLTSGRTRRLASPGRCDLRGHRTKLQAAARVHPGSTGAIATRTSQAARSTGTKRQRATEAGRRSRVRVRRGITATQKSTGLIHMPTSSIERADALRACRQRDPQLCDGQKQQQEVMIPGNWRQHEHRRQCQTERRSRWDCERAPKAAFAQAISTAPEDRTNPASATAGRTAATPKVQRQRGSIWWRPRRNQTTSPRIPPATHSTTSFYT